MDIGEVFAGFSDLAGDAALVAGDDTELSSRVVMVIRLNHVVEQLLFRLVGELDARGVAKKRGDGSTAKLLQDAGMAPAVAHRYVRVGKALNSLPQIASYCVDGALSGEGVDAIVKGVSHIERRIPDLPVGDRDDCVRGLLTEALVGTPGAVAKRARRLALVLSPLDKEVPDAENRELNEVSFGTGDDGRTHGTFDLDNLLGEKLAVALAPLAKQVLEPDGSPDSRSRGQRTADALEMLLDSYLDQEDRPTRGGARPHVTLTVAPESLAGAPSPSLALALSPWSLEWAGPVSLSSAQLVACDSVVTRILVDEDSVPLDVGQDHRSVTPAIRKALIVRDQGCAFPGCGCPPGYTDGHHIQFWSEGGPTSLTNTVLLCRRHHRYIHHLGWTVFIGGDEAQRSSTHVTDGHPWFVKPGGTPADALRSHARRTLTSELVAA